MYGFCTNNVMKVFIISPHPDDAEFGCGGLTLKCMKAKHEITYLLNTKAIDEKDCFYTEERRKEGYSVLKKGINVIEFAFDDTTSFLENLIYQNKPDVLFNVWPKDFNETHRTISKFVDLAVERVRLKKEKYDLPVLGYYETFSSIEFASNIIFDVTKEYVEALNLLKYHKQGIEILPILPYSFQIKHQLHGLEGGVMYGEGINFCCKNQFLWIDNLCVKQDFVDSIIQQ